MTTKIEAQNCKDYATGVKFLEQEFGKEWCQFVTKPVDQSRKDKCVLGQCAIAKDSDLSDYVMENGLGTIFSWATLGISEGDHSYNWQSIVDKAGATDSAFNIATAAPKTEYLIQFEDGFMMKVKKADLPFNVKFKIISE